MVHVNQGSYIHMYAKYQFSTKYIEVDIFGFINKNEKKKNGTNFP
jgi:hypothetical protein